MRLDRRRIYVLPTPFGAFVGVLLLVMLLGARELQQQPGPAVGAAARRSRHCQRDHGAPAVVGPGTHCAGRRTGTRRHAAAPAPGVPGARRTHPPRPAPAASRRRDLVLARQHRRPRPGIAAGHAAPAVGWTSAACACRPPTRWAWYGPGPGCGPTCRCWSTRPRKATALPLAHRRRRPHPHPACTRKARNCTNCARTVSATRDARFPWKHSARRDSLLVREYEQPTGVDVRLDWRRAGRAAL